MQIQRRTFLAMAAFCLSGIPAHRAYAAPENTRIQGPGVDILGVWSSETESQNNHLQLVYTRADVTLIIGRLSDSRYEIEGNTIAIGPVPQPGLPVLRPAPVPFSIDGAALTITRTPGNPTTMLRVDDFQPDVHPIVGSWTYDHPVGVPAVLRFAPGGAMQTMLMLSSDYGPYRLENGMLTMQFSNGPIAVRIKREGNVLTATGANGVPERFVKFG
jgi:hypothetical protein